MKAFKITVGKSDFIVSGESALEALENYTLVGNTPPEWCQAVKVDIQEIPLSEWPSINFPLGDKVEGEELKYKRLDEIISEIADCELEGVVNKFIFATYFQTLKSGPADIVTLILDK